MVRLDGQFPDYAFYFAGDTGYTDDFIQTRERLGAPDLAAIPIGAYDPREFMKASHMNPEEAVRAFEDLQAGQGHCRPLGDIQADLGAAGGAAAASESRTGPQTAGG